MCIEPPSIKDELDAQLPDIVDGISSTIPDPSREAVSPLDWDPGRRLLRAIRMYAYAKRLGGPRASIIQKFAVMEYRFWSIVTGADIPLNTSIGNGLILPHPNGIVLHPDVTIGPNCLIFQQVTIGTSGSRPGVPCIGGHVDIGAGAKILGGVNIGRHAKIGANAVVTIDVPPGAVASGVPAKITRIWTPAKS